MKKIFRILLALVISSNLVVGQGLPSANKYGTAEIPVYLVTNFIGTGQGDTVSAINAAIAAASAGGGFGIVYLPEGTWGIRTSYLSGGAYRPVGIIGASNVTLRGAGAAKTRIVQDAPPVGSTFDTATFATNTHFSSMIRCTNCTNFVVENLSVNGTLSRQINHTSNPYTNPQDGLGNDSLQSDGIYIIGGKRNIIRNVHIDSLQGYGSRMDGCYQCTVDGIVEAVAINGGVYFRNTCNGSVLQNSVVTNNYADNVRITAGGYINIINNEISWSKFDVQAGTSNFAGVYIQNNTGSATVGINVKGNSIHDNSSYALDAFNVDTTNYFFSGTSVLIQGNEIYHNANGGLQIQMPLVSVRDNDIFNNGVDSNGTSDPVSYTGLGIVGHGINSDKLTVTGNRFYNVIGQGKQQYAYGASSVGPVPFFSFTGNTQAGGLGLINTTAFGLKTTSPYNNWFNNTLIDSNRVVWSDVSTDNSGNVIFAPGLQTLGGVKTGVMYLQSDGDAQFFGTHPANNTKFFFIGDQFGIGGATGMGFKLGEYLAGSGIAQRGIGFWDFPTATLRGFVNAAGEFYWGATTSNYSFHAQTSNIVSVSGANAVDIQATGSGSSAGAYNGLNVAFNAGYTGSGITRGINLVNSNAGTGSNIGPAGVAASNYGIVTRATGASATGANVGTLTFGTAALINVGTLSDATFTQFNSASAISIGSLNYALRANASAIEIGGYFGLQSALPTFASAAIVADNGAESVPVALFRVNGVTKIQIDASGNLLPGAATATDLGTAATFYRDIYYSHTVGETAIGVSSGLGTNVSSLTPAGNDEDFQLTVVTSGNVTGTVGLVAFGRTWGATPKCVISVANAATGTAVTSGYVGLNATSASSMTMVGALTGAGTYVFNCHCGQ